MADDTTPDLAKTHPRPEQAEAPVDDIGASDVDLDAARHDDHGHGGHDDHGHDDHGHDDHGDHPVEDPRWVLGPVAVGLLIGVIAAFVLGFGSDAVAFHSPF